MPYDPLTITLTVVLLVISLGVHEAAHAWVALKCGDTTARDMGRITLNPIPHIDLVMTILLPLVLIMSGSPFLFGGAKPVPVAFHRLRHPWRDMSFVAIAGPLSNFLLAILFMLIYKVAVDIFDMEAVRSRSSYQIFPMVMYLSVQFNLILAAFNLIPIPPLDGSRVMAWLLPENMRDTYVRIERYGILLVFALLWMGVLGTVLRPMINGMWDLVYDIVSLGGLW